MPNNRILQRSGSTRIRLACYIVLTVLVLSSVVMWLVSVRPAQIHDAWWFRILEQLEQIRDRPPEGVSLIKWQYLIDWTMNAQANCFTLSEIGDPVRFRQFQRELDVRLAGPVDIATIDWFWDELEKISRDGPTYSEQFRPTLPQRLRLYAPSLDAPASAPQSKPEQTTMPSADHPTHSH